VSVNTGRWSELSAEHEVRYTAKGSSFVTAMSKTSIVAEGLYGLVSQLQRSNGSSRRLNHVSWSAAISNPRFGVEVAGHQYRQYTAETGGRVRSDQWTGR